MPISLKEMRICFLAGSLGRGGAERQLFYILQTLQSLGVSCRVLSLTTGEIYEERIRQINIPVDWVGQHRSKVRRLAAIVNQLQSWHPHIIQSTHSFVNPYAFVAARFMRCLDVGAIRTDFDREVELLGSVGYISFRFPTVLLANSRRAVDAAHAFGVAPNRLRLLENAVDSEQFCPPLMRKYKSNSPLRIICVGNLRQPKRHDVFLNTLARVRQHVPNFRATLVGEGPLRNQLQQLARQLKLCDVLNFAGSSNDMVAVYQNADVLVHTSAYEGMPNVILEAMSCGLPVISTRSGAVPDLVDHEQTGYLTAIGDVDALVTRIVHLSRHPDLRIEMGHAAREKIRQHYSLEALPDKLTALYLPLLQRRYATETVLQD